MMIHLPDDLESSIQAAVDDAMVEAARLLLRELARGRQAETPVDGNDLGPDPFLGSMSDAAEELDQIVADAYRRRREEPWGDVAVE